MQNIVKLKQVIKRLYDSIQLSHFNRKLEPSYKGPYDVVQIHANNTATLQISKSKQRTYHLDILKLFIPDVVKDDDTTVGDNDSTM